MVLRRFAPAGVRFGLGLVVSRVLHHQKPPAPNNATKITPTIVNLITQRTANFAIKTKIASKTTPAIMKMVVKDMGISGQWSVVSGQWSVVSGQ